MKERDYQNIIEHLEAAARVLLNHQGELGDADIRIRHLVSISTSETKRRLREVLSAEAAAVAPPRTAG